MLVKEGLPSDGQMIVATNSVGGCWVEEFDKDEPLGDMQAWYPITTTEYYEANAPSQMAALFIRKNIAYEEEKLNGR